MKVWINKLFILCICSLVLMACEKDEDRITVRTEGTPTLTTSSSTLVLTEDEAANEAVTFSWTPVAVNWSHPSYSHNAVRYTLQIAKEGNNFVPFASVEVDTNLSRTFTVAAFNALMDQLEVAPFVASNIQVRVLASLGPNTEPAISNVQTISVTPYMAAPPYATLYMVGDATEYEWDAAKASPMFRDHTNIFVYTYTGYFKAGNLKFLGERGKWAPMWGSDGSGGATFRATTDDPDPASFTIPAAGYYTVSINLRDLSVNIVPFDASNAVTHASIGIIGGFNNWTDIVPMSSTANNPHIWTIDRNFASDTEMKFRIAEGWTVNWGPENEVARLYGKGVQDGRNMEVKAGNYSIWFNDLTGNYILIKK